MYCFQSLIKFPFLNGMIECPTNETSWIQRSMEKCKDSNYLYHCLPTQYLNDSKEECLTAERIQSGLFLFCLFLFCSIKQIKFNLNCYQCIGFKFTLKINCMGVYLKIWMHFIDSNRIDMKHLLEISMQFIVSFTILFLWKRIQI